ncbi:cytochrome P450 [Dyella flagellata]|uniref:Cytochrome P450 n=1 Tax=Dyella flagellata TaxID=1867833 RepID=A0ABQ5X740_9GAMM|nr:cytochrome P450 [Dyella flagellata]GLQ86858.1 cytochrome P450 [Dyella flagellata]
MIGRHEAKCEVDCQHGSATTVRGTAKPAEQLPPGKATAVGIPLAPGALPIVGHGAVLARKPLQFLSMLARLDDVVEIRLGRLPVYVISNQALIRQLADVDVVSQGMFADLLKPVFGTSVETTSGDEHLWYRRRAQPAFGRAMRSTTIRLTWQEAKAVVGAWQPGQVIDVCQMTDYLVARIMSKSMFSNEIGEDVAATIMQTLPALAESVSLRNPRPEQWWRLVPLPGDRAAAKAGRVLRSALEAAIRLHRQQEFERDDMLSMLQSANKANGEALSDLQLLDMVVDLVAAGANNTGKQIAWAFYEFDANPDVAERVYQEIDELIAGGSLDYDAVPNLPFLSTVITEILRKYGNLAITRRTRRPVTFGKFRLPAGAHVMVSPHIIGRDPRYFPDPDRFVPDRWKSGAEDINHTFIPFGFGAHRCMGDRFAISEITIALVAILAQWRPRVVPGRQVRRRAVVSVRPDNLFMRAELRRQG